LPPDVRRPDGVPRAHGMIRLMIRSGLVLGALLSLASIAVSCKDKGAAPGGDGGATAAKATIAVIPKGTTHEFWKAVHAGAVKASREQNVEVVWKGPLKEDDLKGQIDVVQSFV